MYMHSFDAIGMYQLYITQDVLKLLQGIMLEVICRVIFALNDLLTPFDLRAQNFRVNVEFSTCHRGQKNFSKKCPKMTFRLEKKNFC